MASLNESKLLLAASVFTRGHHSNIAVHVWFCAEGHNSETWAWLAKITSSLKLCNCSFGYFEYPTWSCTTFCPEKTKQNHNTHTHHNKEGTIWKPQDFKFYNLQLVPQNLSVIIKWTHDYRKQPKGQLWINYSSKWIISQDIRFRCIYSPFISFKAFYKM